MRLGTRDNGKRKLHVLQRELERAGAYGDAPPNGGRSGLFIVAGILLGTAVGLLAILVVGLVEILVL